MEAPCLHMVFYMVIYERMLAADIKDLTSMKLL